MFEIERLDDHTIALRGRFDASQEPTALEVFGQMERGLTVDFAELRYVSSAGLGVLFATQKRLSENGHTMRIVNVSPHIREVFALAGFDRIFQME
ncbi:MAG TPA: STAS domain-containing protein [Thermoanaerobaculia bacterium]|nr:STAS domain-containing protein [Thermoanaerobaculia bacterium]